MSQSPFANAPSWQPTVYRVGFNTNRHNISLAGHETIAGLAAVIEGDKAAFVTIVGPPDIAGSANYSTQLSKRRATAVRSALIATGKIAPHQILTAWTGDEKQSLGIFKGLPQAQDRAVGMCIS